MLTTALERLLAVGPISCNPRGLDKYGRTLAVCFVRGRDVNAEMVRQDYAWAFVRYSSSYVREEAEAKAAHRGIWQGEAIPAWDYRKDHWETAEIAGPEWLRHQGQHHQPRPHLPHAPPLVRPDQDGAGQRQTLDLQPGGNHRGRLAAGTGALREGTIGAGDGDRTHDPDLGKVVLYR